MKVLTAQDVEVYFKEKWIEYRCPFCGHHKWSIALKHDGTLFLPYAGMEYDPESGNGILDGGDLDSTQNPPDPPAIASIVLSCQNCHYVANFDYQAILKEVEQWTEVE